MFRQYPVPMKLTTQCRIFSIHSSWGTPHCPIISIYRSLAYQMARLGSEGGKFVIGKKLDVQAAIHNWTKQLTSLVVPSYAILYYMHCCSTCSKGLVVIYDQVGEAWKGQMTFYKQICIWICIDRCGISSNKFCQNFFSRAYSNTLNCTNWELIICRLWI